MSATKAIIIKETKFFFLNTFKFKSKNYIQILSEKTYIKARSIYILYIWNLNMNSSLICFFFNSREMLFVRKPIGIRNIWFYIFIVEKKSKKQKSDN